VSWREAHRRRVEALEAEAAAVIEGALGGVLDTAAARLGQVVTAAAADGEAQASVDDLNVVLADWKAAVDQVVLPYFGGIFEAGAVAAEQQIAGIGVVVPGADPEFLDHAARQYLASTTDRFYLLGDEAWEAARAQLLEGFAAGEGIGSLRKRVQDVTGLTRARAEALARTEVIGASNMGADARVRAMGADAPPYKQWLSTMDGRTRRTHVRADGQVVLFDQRFEVGGSYLRVPGDPLGPAAEVINCRCTTLYLDSAEPLDLDGRQEGGVVDLVADPDLAPEPPDLRATALSLGDASMSAEAALASSARVPVTAYGLSNGVGPDELAAKATGVQVLEDSLGDTTYAKRAQVPVAGLLTDQPTLNPHHVAKLVANPEHMLELGGYGPDDLPQVARIGDRYVIADGHHRAVAEAARNGGTFEAWVFTEWSLSAAAGPPQVDSTTGEPHTGAMVALVPVAPEAWTLGATAEPADALHVTLGYLGESDDMPDTLRAELAAELEALADQLPAPDARVFGTALWNTTGTDPCLVLQLGGQELTAWHDAAWSRIERATVAANATDWAAPENHAPWVAHMCLAYGQPPDLADLVGEASKLEGPIEFDRLRLAIAGQAFDYPLRAGGAVVQPAASMPSAGQILATDSVNLVTPPKEGTMPWEIREGGADCPFEVVKEGTDERAGCHDTRDSAEAQVAALYANEDEGDAAAAPPPLPGEHLRAKMHTQGSATGLRNTGRMFTNTTYRATPFAFHWSKASSAHGGQPVVVHIGNVVRVVPAAAPGQPDYGFVQLDLGSEDGREYARRSVAGFERWGSIGLDETKPTVTMEWGDEAEEDDPLAGLFEAPDLVMVDGGHVGELTGVSVPAQADAEIEPTPELVQAMSDAEPKTTVEDEPVPQPEPAAALPAQAAAPSGADVADAVQALTAAAYTITIPELPPTWWFSEPTDVDMDAGAFNITEDGRVYAVLAPAGTNHRAFAKAGRRQEVPMGRVDYSRFMGAWALTAEGKIPAGPVTMDCGHASRFRANGDVATAHYENSCTVVAKIAVGENRQRGYVWAAGALEPGVTIDQVSRMLACRLSGDWQPHSDKPGWTDFVAALLVPSPGFPMAHGGASATYEGDALVASSVPVRAVAATGRPRLRIDRNARTVQRVGPPSPSEQFAAVVDAVRSGRPLPAAAVTRRKRCC
jgi:hypothetical protein